MKIYSDWRWLGQHGIGRFATEMKDRLGYLDMNLPSKPTKPWDVLLLTCWLLFHPRDYLFSPGFNAPYFFLKRYVFIVHDLNHIDISANTSRLKRIYYYLVLRRAIRSAGAVLTVSKFTSRRIAEWTNIREDRIKIVGCGVSDAFVSSGDSKKLSLPYFLIIGSRKAHKNELNAMRAFAACGHQHEALLVFSGPSSVELLHEADVLNIASSVIFTGSLSEEQLAEYYRGALALIFVSLYEGFGLPAVEAMACGTPVIASCTTSLPEVVGDAALLVDPLDINQIASAISDLWCSDLLRSRLREAGLVRVNQYSWAKVASNVSLALDAVTTSRT